MDKTERIEAEIQFNEENRSKIKDKLTRLKKFYSANQDLVDEIAPSREKERFHKIIQHKINSLEKDLEFDSKSRAGENKGVVFALRDLIYCLEDFDFPRTKQIDIVYDLFKEFNFDDYGKETHTKEILIGEPFVIDGDNQVTVLLDDDVLFKGRASKLFDSKAEFEDESEVDVSKIKTSLIL